MNATTQQTDHKAGLLSRHGVLSTTRGVMSISSVSRAGTFGAKPTVATVVAVPVVVAAPKVARRAAKRPVAAAAPIVAIPPVVAVEFTLPAVAVAVEASPVSLVEPVAVVPQPVVVPSQVVVAQPLVVNGVSTPIWTHEEYHADTNAVSCSVLKKILRSADHMQAYREAPNKTTSARLIGTSFHAAVLEPVEFANNVVVWTGGDRRGAKYTSFVKANPGKAILKPNEFDDIVGMRDSVMSYSEYPIGSLIANGTNESSIVWVDKETQVTCKIRPDSFSQPGTFDLKSTDDCRPYAFIRQCVKLDYDLQAFMYTEGIFQKTGEKRDFYFIATETDAPYATWVHQASAAMLASGQIKFRRALERYAECLKTKQFPGYEMPCSIIEWPKYA